MDKSDQQAWLKWCGTTSVPLRQLSPDGQPIDIASGCLLDFQSRRFLLTVRHAVDLSSSGWVVELEYDPAKGTEVYQPAMFLHIGEMKKGSGDIGLVDYAYAEVPKDLQPVFDLRSPRGPVAPRRNRHIFRAENVTEPEANTIYAFSGQVCPEMHGSLAMVTECHVYPGLRYESSDGPFHSFALPVKHPGHDAFEGCSGAPIVDTHRRIVALVSSGDKETNNIRAISVSKYIFALDFYCREIRPD